MKASQFNWRNIQIAVTVFVTVTVVIVMNQNCASPMPDSPQFKHLSSTTPPVNYVPPGQPVHNSSNTTPTPSAVPGSFTGGIIGLTYDPGSQTIMINGYACQVQSAQSVEVSVFLNSVPNNFNDVPFATVCTSQNGQNQCPSPTTSPSPGATPLAIATPSATLAVTQVANSQALNACLLSAYNAPIFFSIPVPAGTNLNKLISGFVTDNNAKPNAFVNSGLFIIPPAPNNPSSSQNYFMGNNSNVPFFAAVTSAPLPTLSSNNFVSITGTACTFGSLVPPPIGMVDANLFSPTLPPVFLNPTGLTVSNSSSYPSTDPNHTTYGNLLYACGINPDSAYQKFIPGLGYNFSLTFPASTSFSPNQHVGLIGGSGNPTSYVAISPTFILPTPAPSATATPAPSPSPSTSPPATPTPSSSNLTQIYCLISNKHGVDRLYSKASDEGASLGYSTANSGDGIGCGATFKLLSSPVANSHDIYRCLAPNGYHKFSVDRTCDGFGKNEGTWGYAYDKADSGLTPLNAFYKNNDYVITADTATAPALGFQPDVTPILGYVPWP